MRKKRPFHLFETLETKRLMTADLSSEVAATADQTCECATVESMDDLAAQGDNTATAKGPSSSEIKKHSAITLKVGSKGTAAGTAQMDLRSIVIAADILR